MIAFMTGAVSESQATVTVYQAQNSDGSGNLDTICDKNTFDSLTTIEMVVDPPPACADNQEDKVAFQISDTNETDMLAIYLDNGGYAVDTYVADQLRESTPGPNRPNAAGPLEAAGS
jgi:hypothetical protein